jgi:hypothetical protein
VRSVSRIREPVNRLIAPLGVESRVNRMLSADAGWSVTHLPVVQRPASEAGPDNCPEVGFEEMMPKRGQSGRMTRCDLSQAGFYLACGEDVALSTVSISDRVRHGLFTPAI